MKKAAETNKNSAITQDLKEESHHHQPSKSEETVNHESHDQPDTDVDRESEGGLELTPETTEELNKQAELLRAQISHQKDVLKNADALTESIRVELCRLQSDLVRVELKRMGQIPL